MICKYFGR